MNSCTYLNDNLRSYDSPNLQHNEDNDPYDIPHNPLRSDLIFDTSAVIASMYIFAIILLC